MALLNLWNSLFILKQQQNSFGSNPIWILVLTSLELHLLTEENIVWILVTNHLISPCDFLYELEELGKSPLNVFPH